MKKLFFTLFILVLLIAGYLAWQVLGPSTGFREKEKFLYIKSDHPSKEYLIDLIRKDSITDNIHSFSLVGDRLNYWKNIKPGKYKIEQDASVLNIIRKLKNGQQEPVKLVILKFRTKEALAGAIGKKLECDSTSFISFVNNPDSMRKLGVDTNSSMTILFPNTYTYFWNTTPSRIFNKFYLEHEKIWTDERKKKATEHNLTPVQAYILASIIEEETNDKEDKPLMASVYLNRLEKGIRLDADPTIKFAMRNFEIKRIYTKYFEVESPYNTYRYTGLPPGPICTPTVETLDAVLNSPRTEYLYFVAKSDFSGSHIFNSSFEEHLKYAKAYQAALDEYEKLKISKDSSNKR